MIEHIKHTARNLKYSPHLSVLASLTLLLVVALPILLFITPDYLYFSGKEFRNFVFSLNYEVVPALIFIFALFPLIMFEKFSFLSFGVSYCHFKNEIKNSSSEGEISSDYFHSVIFNHYSIIFFYEFHNLGKSFA